MESGSGWENVPAIKLIISTRVTLGPGGLFPWAQTDVKGPYWRIYWNDAPGAFVRCGGREVELTPERIVALSPDAVYSTRAERLVKHFYVHCFVGRPFSEIKGKMFVWEDPALTRLGAKLGGEANGRAAEPRAQMALLVYLNSVLLAIPEEDVPERPAYSPKVAKAVETLESAPRLSNDVLARRAGMSRNGFLALFKKETKTSPQAYSRQLRLNEACAMLQHGDKTIDDIAQETGFCDRYHFSRAFHQTIGYTPAQFRKRRLPSPEFSL